MGMRGLVLALAVMTCADARWIRLRSATFELYSSATETAARETLLRLEQTREFFEEHGGATRLPRSVRVLLFESAEEYEPFRLNSFAMSYYKLDANGHTIVLNQIVNRSLRAGVHEYVHLWIQQSGRALPVWLEEGLSEYYSTLHFSTGRAAAGEAPEGRVEMVQNGSWIPLERLVRLKPGQHPSFYSMSWALTHMLKLAPQYRPKFAELERTLDRGVGSPEALERVYGKRLARIEADLRAYLTVRPAGRETFVMRHAVEDAGGPAEEVSAARMLPTLVELVDERTGLKPLRARYARLALSSNERAEMEAAQGLLAWRDNDMAAAKRHFRRAHGIDPRNEVAQEYLEYMQLHDPERAAAINAELM
jgi:hypothetical protein